MIEHALLPEGNWIPTRCEDCPFCGKMDPDEESVYGNTMDQRHIFVHCARIRSLSTVRRAATPTRQSSPRPRIPRCWVTPMNHGASTGANTMKTTAKAAKAA